jgi:beta-galactosidase/beta-glucuronidase
MRKYLHTLFIVLLSASLTAKEVNATDNGTQAELLVPGNAVQLSSGMKSAQSQSVAVKNWKDGYRLEVDGQPFFIHGMNWDYFPVGTNFNYSLWKQSDDLIQAALDAEMSLLKNMGVNTIRMYTGVPARWIEYIYKNYGIYTMLNHSFGRYGLTIDGNWFPNTDYSNPKVREILFRETKEMVQQYQNTPGILLFLLGNENNYGVFWR